MPYCVFVESRIYAAHGGKQIKFLRHQFAGGRLEWLPFPKEGTFLKFFNGKITL
jgi:hypothetical protein